jgi:hypothetical protein
MDPSGVIKALKRIKGCVIADVVVPGNVNLNSIRVYSR